MQHGKILVISLLASIVTSQALAAEPNWQFLNFSNRSSKPVYVWVTAFNNVQTIPQATQINTKIAALGPHQTGSIRIKYTKWTANTKIRLAFCAIPNQKCLQWADSHAAVTIVANSVRDRNWRYTNIGPQHMSANKVVDNLIGLNGFTWQSNLNVARRVISFQDAVPPK